MQYEIHPFAELFPMLSDDELKEMSEDIKANTQRFNIVTVRGKVIDGRNRLAACALAGVSPKIKDYSDQLKDDEAVYNFIISMNFKRRNLNASQRAVIAQELLEVKLKKKKVSEAKANISATAADSTPSTPSETTEKVEEKEEEKVEGRTEMVKAVAEQAQVSPAYVHQAEELKKKSPERYAEVVKGDKTISEARKELKEEEAEAKGGEKKKKTAKPITDADLQKTAKKIVDNAQARLEELGFTLKSTEIEKL